MRKPEWLSRILRPFKQYARVHVTPYLPGGWRTAALVNTVLMILVSILMTVLSLVALTMAGGFNKPLVFFTGACGTSGASALNATLHILINIISTAMLASSNMFMQTLNAPSREEVDQSHARGSWLEIGVLSGRNILRLSPFKTTAWLGFLASSVPIHLLFNSAIFQSSYKFSQYDLAIVSEPFIHGGNYSTPGASLLNSGGLTIYDANKTTSTQSPDLWAGYGDFVDLTEYRDNNSAINERIAVTAQNGSSWTRISKEACKQEYLTCSGLSTHSDVIIVVSDTDGWSRSQVWGLNKEQESFWDDYVPNDTPEPEHNSLWFYGKCAMSAYSGNGLTVCGNSCRWALGGSNATQDWVLPFFPINSTAKCAHGWPREDFSHSDVFNSSSIDNPKQINSTADCFVMRTLGDNRYRYGDWNDSSTYDPKQNDLNVDHCLARPVQESCKVALSTTLLVCVTGCAVLKAILCVWVYCRLRIQNPLTTPGDAINSFISEPDPHTVGMSLLSQGEIRMSSFCGAPQPGPRKYRRRDRKLGTTVPWSEWLFLLVTMISALAVAVALIGIMGMGAGGIRGGFGTNSSNPLTNSGTSLLGAVLIANSPQLVLSTIYVIYNNMFTRLVVGKAWAIRSTQHSYLRVTDAKGPQRSTYRLQLPYRYSVPLIISSAFLHWLMSNTIYVFISQGDYFQDLSGSGNSTYSDSNLPPGSTVSVGYSVITLAMLALGLLVGFVLPSVWSQKPLIGFGNSVGCNSFAISASCHVSTLSRPDSESDISRKLSEIDLDRPEALNVSEAELALLSPAGKNSGIGQEDERLKKIAQSRLRWGVVKMPPEWSSQYSDSYDQVGHVSFGTTNDEVEEPVHDRWYA